MWSYLILALNIVYVCGTNEKETCTSDDPFLICPFDSSKVILTKFLRNKNYRTQVCEILEDFHSCYHEKQENLTLNEICHPLFSSLVSSKEMSRDLCESESPSQFHHEFYQTFRCYIDWSDDLQICTYESEKIFSGYLAVLKRLYEDTEPPERFRICLKMTSKMDCFAKRIYRGCGEKARNTFVEFLGGMHFMQMYCTQAEYQDASNIIEVVKRANAETIEKEISVKDLMEMTDFL